MCNKVSLIHKEQKKVRNAAFFSILEYHVIVFDCEHRYNIIAIEVNYFSKLFTEHYF